MSYIDVPLDREIYHGIHRGGFILPPGTTAGQFVELTLLPVNEPLSPQHSRPAPDIEALAAAAHQAWLKEKQAQGWADHPIAVVGYDAISTMGLRASTGCVKCGRTLERHHPNMVPYAALSEADKDLDRKMVLTVLRAMGCLMAPDCPECERMLRAYAAEEWTTRAAVTAYIAYRAHRATHEVEQEEPKDHGR